MAIYHCSLKVFSRSKGHSAVAAAAYRAGVKLWDERRDRYHRYDNRKGVVKSFLLVPEKTPHDFYDTKSCQSGLPDRAFLWNAAERAENRKNSCVARELVLALPHELSGDHRSALIHDMALWMVKRYSVAIDAAIHAPADGDGHDSRNHHAHLLFTTRELTEDGFGKKTRILDDKITGKAETELIREVWETLANAALENAGLPDIKIDRRSLEDQGVDRLPQTHLGSKAHRALHAVSSSTLRSVYNDTDEGDDDGSSDRGGGGGSSANITSSNSEDERSEDSTEEGSSSSSGSMGQISFNMAAHPPHSQQSITPLQIKQVIRPHSVKKIQPQALLLTDLTSKLELYEYVRVLNEQRERLPDKALPLQIREVDMLIDVLHDEIKLLKPYLRKPSIADNIKASIKQIMKQSARVLKARRIDHIKDQIAVKFDQSRSEYQQVKYSRTYRKSIKHQINNMETLLTRLHTRKEQHQKLELFYNHIDYQLKAELPHTAMTFLSKVMVTHSKLQALLMPKASKPIIVPKLPLPKPSTKPIQISESRERPQLPQNTKTAYQKDDSKIDTSSIETKISFESNKIINVFKSKVAQAILPDPVPTFIKRQHIIPDTIRQASQRNAWFSEGNIGFKEAEHILTKPHEPAEQGIMLAHIFNHDVPQKRTSIPEQLEDLKMKAPLLRFKIPKAFKPSKAQIKKVRVSKGFNAVSNQKVKPIKLKKSFLPMKLKEVSVVI